MTASGHESDEGDRVTANGHVDLPGEHGIANAVDGVTGHVESGLPESKSERDGIGSGPKTMTVHVATARGRTATETMTASDALDSLTARGKRSESENGGHGHESCPTMSGLYDPSLFLNPKIEKHGRIENGSGPPKLPSTHHVAERAAMSGEKQPRKRRGQGESNVTEQPPSLQLLKESNRRAPRETSTPLAGSRSSGRRGSLTGRNTRCTPSHPPPPPPRLLSCPPEGREEEEEVPGCLTSEEVRARGEAFDTGGTEPERQSAKNGQS